MSGVITGSEERKEKHSEAVFGTMRSKHGADCHIATSPRRDVRSRICISSFNVRTARKLGHREAYEQRHGFPEPEDPDFKRLPGIRTASILLDIIEDIMMMFLRRDILFFSFMMF